ncbi:MAG TPA: sensor histidine kinase [Bacillota bacterium]
MNQRTGDVKNKLNNPPERDNIRKVLPLTTGFGGFFGLVVTFLIFSMYGFPTSILPFIIGVPLFCACIAGLAGVIDIYINRFLTKIGIINSLKWQIIGIVFVILITMTLGLSIAAYFGFIKDQVPFVATTSIIGLIFGIIVGMIDHYLWRMRQKVLTLEIENKYLAELAEKDQQVQETTKNLIIAEERNRMARDLHDSISQGIHGIVYTIHSLRQELGNGTQRTAEILDHLERTADATLSELKTMIMELKPSLMEEKGLTEAIRLNCDLLAERFGIKMDLRLDSNTGLSPGQEIALYRIIQEALANIQKHAGAKQVQVSLESGEKQQVRLMIQDDGRGFDMGQIHRGNGLNNMEARCLENHGTLKIITRPGAGTKIEARFPCCN